MSTCNFHPGEYGLMAIILIAVPLLLAVFFGLFAFRRATPLVYSCRRCDHPFRQAPHRPFPEACPRCGARDWESATPSGDRGSPR